LQPRRRRPHSHYGPGFVFRQSDIFEKASKPVRPPPRRLEQESAKASKVEKAPTRPAGASLLRRFPAFGREGKALFAERSRHTGKKRTSPHRRRCLRGTQANAEAGFYGGEASFPEFPGRGFRR